MEKRKNRRKWSLKTRLIQAFLVTSIIPVIIMNLLSYYNTSRIVTDHVAELTHANLMQTRSSLDVWMESYEDILFQIYTDDSIVEMIDNINNGEDVAVNKNQLRRTLHGLFYTKEYIKCITVITDDGTMVCYDMLTGSTVNAWTSTFEMTEEELYETVSQDNQTHIFSTQGAIPKGGEDYYLFHLGHRIIDYRDVPKRLGIVVVSIDESMLKNVCSSEEDIAYSYNFIVDAEGNMVSSPDNTLLTTTVLEQPETDEKEKKAQYQKYAEQMEQFRGKPVFVSYVHDDTFNWDIVNISSQDELVKRLTAQQGIMLTILAASLLALGIIIVILIRSLTRALNNLVRVMKTAGQGNLEVRVEEQSDAPLEVETISTEFNGMLERLSDSMKKEKEAGEKQRAAEIAALEAQMNPHFLYNTLDTINWMAIDKEEYEISNSINALANILRYGIDHSNGMVTVRQEQEWLKKYVFLQQTRLKNQFTCEIHIEPGLLDCMVHKLLLQPFIENSIIHGFEGVSRAYFLSVTMAEKDGKTQIEIYDNGKGIPAEMLEQMNRGIFPKSESRNHIGMENAISRLHIYYGDAGKVHLESEEGRFTKIQIEIPMEKRGGGEDEDRSDRG